MDRAEQQLGAVKSVDMRRGLLPSHKQHGWRILDLFGVAHLTRG